MSSCCFFFLITKYADRNMNIFNIIHNPSKLVFFNLVIFLTLHTIIHYLYLQIICQNIFKLDTSKEPSKLIKKYCFYETHSYSSFLNLRKYICIATFTLKNVFTFQIFETKYFNECVLKNTLGWKVISMTY